MVQFVLVKVAVQSASQSWPTETRVALPRAGITWPLVAAGGAWKGRLDVGVEVVMAPLGFLTETALLL